MNNNCEVINIEYMKQKSLFIAEIESPVSTIQLTGSDLVNNFLASFNNYFLEKQLSQEAMNDFIYYADMGLMRLDFIINCNKNDDEAIQYIVELFLYDINADYLIKMNPINTFNNMERIEFRTTKNIFIQLINICYEHKFRFSLDYFTDDEENN